MAVTDYMACKIECIYYQALCKKSLRSPAVNRGVDNPSPASWEIPIRQYHWNAMHFHAFIRLLYKGAVLELCHSFKLVIRIEIFRHVLLLSSHTLCVRACRALQVLSLMSPRTAGRWPRASCFPATGSGRSDWCAGSPGRVPLCHLLVVWLEHQVEI